MKTRLIRILGTVLSVFGVTTTANASNTGFCQNPTQRGFETYRTHEVARYTIETGNTWYVAWPNNDYSGNDNTRPWIDLDYFEVATTFQGHTYYSISLAPVDAYLNAPEVGQYCARAIEPGITAYDMMSGVAGRNICVKGEGELTFYSAETGVFKYFGCCYTGNVTTGTGTGGSGYSGSTVSFADCPCLYREADSSGQYDSEYGKITTHEVVEQIRTYEFINCSPGYYQQTGDDGSSETVHEGSSGKTVFIIHPGFGWVYSFDFASADPCVIPSHGTSNNAQYCTNAGCTEYEYSGWFGGYDIGSCYACPNSPSDVSGPTQNGTLVFAETVASGVSNFSALISTVGINSCKLASYKVTDSKGTINYSCDSTYK